MDCENRYCIYQENGKCLLSSISLDIIGQCTECIMVTLDEAELENKKRKERRTK